MPWPDHCPSAQTSARVHRGSGRAGSIITFTMVPYSEGVYHNAHINKMHGLAAGTLKNCDLFAPMIALKSTQMGRT